MAQVPRKGESISFVECSSYQEGKIMKKVIRNIFVVTLVSVGSAQAADISAILAPAQVSLTYIHTSKNQAPGAENTATIATTSLQAPCTKGVYIDLDRDSLAYETILEGLTLGKNINLLYNTSMASPWGDPAWCAVSAAGIQWL
jgi:hypothetical protein